MLSLDLPLPPLSIALLRLAFSLFLSFSHTSSFLCLPSPSPSLRSPHSLYLSFFLSFFHALSFFSLSLLPCLPLSLTMISFRFSESTINLQFSVRVAENFPIDVYYLMDHSASLRDDLSTLKAQAQNLGNEDKFVVYFPPPSLSLTPPPPPSLTHSLIHLLSLAHL